MVQYNWRVRLGRFIMGQLGYVVIAEGVSRHFIRLRDVGPEYVKMQLMPTGETIFVHRDTVKLGPIRSAPFEEDVRDLFRLLHQRLSEVYPVSVEEWEDGFRRDTNPEQEIALWLKMSEVYERYGSCKPDIEARKDVFRLILSYANNGNNEVLAGRSLQVLSREEAADLWAKIVRAMTTSEGKL